MNFCPIHIGKIRFETGEQAVTAPCGHIFCLACITRYYNGKKSKLPCPICKESATRKQIITLYPNAPNSPDSSPVKRREGQTLRGTMRGLGIGSSANVLDNVAREMDRFSGNLVDTRDGETKLLADEIKTLAHQFSTMIVPELAIRLEMAEEKVEKLETENSTLKAALQRKASELETLERRRMLLDQDLANIRMGKKIADDKASSSYEKLVIVSEKLQDALKTIETKDEIIQSKAREVMKYKRWLSEHKQDMHQAKNKIKELTRERNAQKLLAPSDENSDPLGKEGKFIDVTFDRSHKSCSNVTEPPPKRQRVQPRLEPSDMVLDKSCFVAKPPPTWKASVTTVSQQRPVLGLNLKNGQPVGKIAVGSRQRMSKRG